MQELKRLIKLLQRNIPTLQLWNIFNWEPLTMWSESSVQLLGWASILNRRGKSSLMSGSRILQKQRAGVII